MTPVPNDLPPVIGKGKLVKFMNITWHTLNQILAILREIQPVQTTKTRVNRTSLGTSIEVTGGDGEDTQGEGEESRWA